MIVLEIIFLLIACYQSFMYGLRSGFKFGMFKAVKLAEDLDSDFSDKMMERIRAERS